jgi:hypothetical protein
VYASPLYITSIPLLFRFVLRLSPALPVLRYSLGSLHATHDARRLSSLFIGLSFSSFLVLLTGLVLPLSCAFTRRVCPYVFPLALLTLYGVYGLSSHMYKRSLVFLNVKQRASPRILYPLLSLCALKNHSKLTLLKVCPRADDFLTNFAYQKAIFLPTTNRTHTRAP